MNHKKFVITSSVALAAIVGLVGALAVYTNYGVKASIPGLPRAIDYLPGDSVGVFGMNVQKFVASPVFARLEEKHGRQIGGDLQEFIARTGVDPRRDISYIIAAGRKLGGGDESGVIIAVGQFNTAAITTFIQTQGQPIPVEYKGATVLMIPEASGKKLEKGIAFLSESEIALGDLETLKNVLDVRDGTLPGVLTNPVLSPLLSTLNPDEMFWFAGDAATVLAKAPTNTPLGDSVSAIENVFGTLNLTDAISGRITATAKNEETARKLADVARGIVALGQLAGEKNQELADLMRGVSVTQEVNKVRLIVNIPIDVLEKLEHAKQDMRKVL